MQPQPLVGTDRVLPTEGLNQELLHLVSFHVR